MAISEVRFWAKVAKGAGDACWLWTGALGHNGYGAFLVEQRTRRAHRVAWTIAFGPVADGLQVLHRCDTPACVRVSHLFLGTNRENLIDMTSKGRRVRGPTHGMTKLDDARVRSIRSAVAAGEQQKSVAKRFGVTAPLVSQIVLRKIWRDVSDVTHRD